MKVFIFAVIVAEIGLVLSIQTAAGAQLYQVTDLGTVNGSTRSEARGITREGVVWGENFNTDYPYFIWFENTNHGVAKPAAVAAMALYGMNNNRQFAGFFSYSQPSRNLAFLGTPLQPQSLNQTNFSPRAVNIHGDIVGVTSIKVEIYPGGPLALVNRPALVHGNQFTILPSLAGSNVWNNAEATAINDSGHIVGWSHTGSLGSGSNPTHAFLWDGAMHDLHTLSTRTNSFAVAINNNDMVTGYRKDGAFTANEPFYWTAASNMVALSVPGGYSSAQPLGINNRGDVVGVADSSAVLWTNGVMTDLQTVISNVPAWDLDGAYGINDLGEICGYGKNGGLTKAFLLRPTNVPPAQFRIELLDPGDPSASNALTGTTVTANADILNSLFVHRGGVTADGAACLLLRASTTNHGTVTLSLRAADGASGVTTNSAENGSVGNVGGTVSLALDRYDTPTEDTAQGIRAYALYHAPQIYHRTGSGLDDSALFQRVINLQAVFTPDSGPAATQTVSIIIVRPPVIVFHGLWSDATQSFSGFIQSFRAAETGVQIFDPSYPNAISFASNATEVPKAVNNARAALREQNFACTRADIFAHSMGGILSRIYAGRADFERPDNFGRGDIYRLVTIDSPHRGSFFGDAIKRTFLWLDANALIDVHRWLADKMTKNKMPPELGAGDDLLTTSVAISNLNQRATDVAAHVIVGDFTVGGDLKNLPQPLGGFYGLLDEIPGLNLGSLFFAPLPNTDLIVSTDSQNAGMGGNATTTYNHQHIGAANTINVISKCLSLYRKPSSSDQYVKGFPTGWISPPPAPLPPGPVNLLQLIESAANLIFSAGPNANSGTTVSVSVSEPPGTNFISVLLLTPDLAMRDTNAPFDFMLPIPAEAVGDYPVTYLATDNYSNLWSGTKLLSVTPLASLNYLEASPRRFIFTRLGDSEQIIVTGNYLGMSRNLTDPSTGTTYVSANTNVVSVNGDGVMTAKGPGTTQITISKSGNNAYVDAVVSPLPSPDLAVQVTASVSNANTGAPVIFSLRVTNAGPQNATAVYLADALPADAQFQSATASQGVWSFTNGLFAVELGALGSGSNATATISVAFTNNGMHLSTATVSSPGLDVNSSDNLASAIVNVSTPLVLTFRFDSTNVVLIWPTNAAGYQLEDTTNLAPPTTWNLTSSNPPPIGGEYQYPVPPTNTERYFRLRHP